jgi:membrane-associated protease RseP (regulator of RpoE activity)
LLPEASERPKVLLPAILFAATVLTTLLAGIRMQIGFLEQTAIPPLTEPRTWLLGVPFSFTLLSILMAHELGHFVMCRYYGITATYPHLLPAPPPLPFGTFGAVIRIKSPFGSARQVFDVGIAGPIAGFVVLIPALLYGLSRSQVFVEAPAGGIEFGEPLLFKLLSDLLFSSPEPSINLHPVGWAAWFGMLATSLNLLPIGQLDGGHIIYALFGPRTHRLVSIAGLLLLSAVSLASLPLPGYLLFGILLLLIGFRHPQPMAEGDKLGSGRWLLALFSLLILILTFILVPVRIS